MDFRSMKVSLVPSGPYSELLKAVGELKLLRDASSLNSTGNQWDEGDSLENSSRKLSRVTEFFIERRQAQKNHEGQIVMAGQEAAARYHVRNSEDAARKVLGAQMKGESVTHLVHDTEQEELQLREKIEEEYEHFFIFASTNEPAWKEAAVMAQLAREQQEILVSQQREAERQRADWLSEQALQLVSEAQREKENLLKSELEDWFVLAEIQFEEVQQALIRDRASQAERRRVALAEERKRKEEIAKANAEAANAAASSRASATVSPGSSTSGRGSSGYSSGSMPGHTYSGTAYGSSASSSAGFGGGGHYSGYAAPGVGPSYGATPPPAGGPYPGSSHATPAAYGAGMVSSGRGAPPALYSSGTASTNNYGSGSAGGAALPTFTPGSGAAPSSGFYAGGATSGRGGTAGARGGGARPAYGGGYSSFRTV